MTNEDLTGPALRAAWLERAHQGAGRDRTSWRTPGVDAVVSALVGTAAPNTLADALRVLAWERSAAPERDLDALLGEIDALWSVLDPVGLAPVSRRQARRWTIDAWVDAIAADQGAPCIDPLSGLHTPEYLFGRVQELDRAARDGEPSSLMLIAVRWTEPTGPWLRIAAVVRIAAGLTDLVRPEATLCQAGTHTALALVPDDETARRERAALASALSGEALTDARLSVELVPVPEQRDELRPLVERLRSHP